MFVSLNTYDPVDAKEGALDPLGLNSIADRLANRLTPGIRERMRHPRFLTALAVGSEICRAFPDQIAEDGITTPQIVFEWYVVQGFYKIFRESDGEIRGVPGIQKAKEGWLEKLGFSHSRYLKTAPIFGFSGVYKTLAEELDIVTDGTLGENGDFLLRTWSQEQGLAAFLGSDGLNGPGKQFKQTFRNAIFQSLQKGEVAHQWNWSGFQPIAERLAPYRAGNKEKKFLSTLLMQNENGYRAPLLQNLPFFLSTHPDNNWRERSFHEFLIKNADKELKDLLETIISYEIFVRVLANSFYDLLYYLSDKFWKISIKELLAANFANLDFNHFRDFYNKALLKLANYGESFEFEKQFSLFSTVNEKGDFLVNLIKHHQQIQKKKPPFGKAPWLEVFDDGTYMVRPLYRQEKPVTGRKDYVNSYRVYSLISFLADLKD